MSNKTENHAKGATQREWNHFFHKVHEEKKTGDVCIGVQKHKNAKDVFWTAEESQGFCKLKEQKFPKLGYMAKKDVRDFMEKFPRSGTQVPNDKAPENKTEILGGLSPKTKEETPASQWFYESYREMTGVKLPIETKLQEVEWVEKEVRSSK